MDDYDWFGRNRFVCDVLEEMRACYKTRNFAHLKGLIEEAQSYCSRMESALSDQKDFISLNEKVGKLRAELKQLRKEEKSLKKEDKESKPETSTQKDI